MQLPGTVVGNATITSVHGLTPTNSSSDTNNFTVPVTVTLMSPSGGSPELTQQLGTVFENVVDEISRNTISINVTFSIIQRFGSFLPLSLLTKVPRITVLK